jgi:hypothetical protein
MNVVSPDQTTVIIKQGRSISGVVPNVVVQEDMSDTLTMTEHPVEFGPTVTDNAYVNPCEVTMRVAWSDASLASNSGSAFTSVADVYRWLLTLQKSRAPMDVVTGKRAYANMLIRSLGVTTDQNTENVLAVVVTFREVILVQTQATTLSPETQASPQQTAPVQNLGTKQPQAVDASKVPATVPHFSGGH